MKDWLGSFFFPAKCAHLTCVRNTTRARMDELYIPDDIISLIIGILDSRSQLEARLVSKDWLQANFYSLIFNWAEPGKMKDFVDHLVNYSFVKQIIFFKSKKMVKEDALALARLTNLRILRFSELYGTRFDLSQDEWMQFSDLTNLQEFHFNGNYPAKLLTCFPYLNRLDLSVKDYSVADQMNVVSKATNLQSLGLRFDKDIIQAIISIDRLTEIRAIPKLNTQYGADAADVLQILTNLKSLTWDLNCIPPMHMLTKLQYLDITLKAPSPDLLSKNQNLTGLRLNTVAASPEFCKSLTSLYKLRFLAMHELSMPLENFQFLTQLLHLEEFEATKKRAVDFIKSDALLYLNSLHLTKLVCQVEDRYFTHLTKLRELTCNSATISLFGFTQLESLTCDILSANIILTNLKKLHIKSSKPIEFLAHPHLEELTIDSKLSPNLIPRLSAFRNLTRLQFYFPDVAAEMNNISPIMHQLSLMTNIQRLQLRRVEEKYSVHLTGLSALTNLRILQLSGELTQEVKDSLTSIKHLDFI